MNKYIGFTTGFAFLLPTLHAQDTGRLYGTVTDPAGAIVVNAEIIATSVERGNTRQTASNEKGEWVLTLMPLGTYNIRVAAPGFKAFDRQGIAVGAEDNVKIDAALEVGATNETVTVT